MSRDGRRRVLTYDERVLWSTVTQSMKPLRPDAAPAGPEPAASDARQPVPKAKSEVKPQPPETLIAPSPPKPAPIAPPLSRRAKRNVARGKHEIDARLDLHGLTQSEAHHALLRFLRTASARDARLVLVITGKGKAGSHDEGRERGVLRRQVPQWLSLPEFRDYVVGFEDAHIAHGGEGALYVRVRRARD
ncbi:Smr/MutS family protein [Undibacter mobilis]|uniref:DNA mismatch repair protein MutS n=1 Tax=Undibacter mobilis TaxID=2292256 RepID=A0A371B8Z7_9BRAD|nr:Smr/MutS family protein [Undibacter mobilis]RDV04058.1 DNA mismatch repair protein MutS [Undibacter mobilis]